MGEKNIQLEFDAIQLKKFIENNSVRMFGTFDGMCTYTWTGSEWSEKIHIIPPCSKSLCQGWLCGSSVDIPLQLTNKKSTFVIYPKSFALLSVTSYTLAEHLVNAISTTRPQNSLTISPESIPPLLNNFYSNEQDIFIKWLWVLCEYGPVLEMERIHITNEDQIRQILGNNGSAPNSWPSYFVIMSYYYHSEQDLYLPYSIALCEPNVGIAPEDSEFPFDLKNDFLVIYKLEPPKPIIRGKIATQWENRARIVSKLLKNNNFGNIEFRYRQSAIKMVQKNNALPQSIIELNTGILYDWIESENKDWEIKTFKHSSRFINNAWPDHIHRIHAIIIEYGNEGCELYTYKKLKSSLDFWNMIGKIPDNTMNVIVLFKKTYQRQ